ncbi:MAG: hypothetical protein HYZ84_01355, partial [Candidatus Omnitrophica bacterium]|nr:hypothetical protein [Candidatus Omnitrophota bacterium]
MKKIVAGFLILGLIFPSPAYSMRAKATANARNGLRLDFIGDLLKMGAAQKPPVLIRSEYRAHNPYASGVVPSEEIVAKPRPVRFAADRIAAGVFARGLIGIGDPDQVDLTAQDISDRAYHSQGLDVEYMGMEGGKHGVYTTGYVQSGAHQAGSRISVPGSKGVIRVYADVTEGTDMIMSGNQDVGGSGGQSMAIDGSLADVFGVLFDDLGAEMMVGRVPLDQMKNFLPIQGGQALDPSNPVESAQRLLAANGITWKDAQAFYQRRKRSIKSVLEPLQSQPGLTVTQIQNGTVDAALLAMLGRKTGKYVFTAGTAGSTEAASNYLEALAMEGVVVSFRILSPLAKAVADE